MTSDHKLHHEAAPAPPAAIDSEEELEQLLSEPTPAVRAALATLDSDLYILGVGGKMGPTLARMAARALHEIKSSYQVYGVARFTDSAVRDKLEAWGVRTIACDLLDPAAVHALPDTRNIIFMAGQKFGTTGQADMTWASNTYVPGLVAARYSNARIVVFSTGNVYPLSPVVEAGVPESGALEPIGEYANSCIGRERLFEYFSRRHGLRCAVIRLSYAIDLRYGILVDLAQRVRSGEPVALEMGVVNLIWQGDANARALALLRHCSVPPLVLNITGPEAVSIRQVAQRLGDLLGRRPVFSGSEAPTALLIDSSRSHGLFGYPRVSLDQMIAWTAGWVSRGGTIWNKPTHFEVRDGKF
jgi:nucleoside-diphosphate-sugar epimerase